MKKFTIAVSLAMAVALGGATQALVASGPAGQSPSQAVSRQEATAPRLDLNTATAAQLEALPGVGPATAIRIIEYRESVKRFGKIEELMNVRGIGEKSFLRLRPMIMVGPPSKEGE